jgi:hypothetical protein
MATRGDLELATSVRLGHGQGQQPEPMIITQCRSRAVGKIRSSSGDDAGDEVDSGGQDDGAEGI